MQRVLQQLIKMRHTFKTRRYQFDQDIYIRSRRYGWWEIHIGYSTNKRWKYTYNDIFLAFMGRVAIPLYGLISPCCCACPKSWSGFRTRDVGALLKMQSTVFRLLTDFVCLYNYEFWLSLCKIVRSSVILLLPLLVNLPINAMSIYLEFPSVYIVVVFLCSIILRWCAIVVHYHCLDKR